MKAFVPMPHDPLLIFILGLAFLALTAYLVSQNRQKPPALGEHMEHMRHHMESQQNDWFSRIVGRLTIIDQTQRRLESLTENLLELKNIFHDKRARGAFAEKQLENILSNVYPSTHMQNQAILSNGKRVDCLLSLPLSQNAIGIDAKFPLENYRLALANEDNSKHWQAFRQDMKKHIDDIATRYINPPETTDAAVLFLPTESLLIDCLHYAADLFEMAQQKRVWLVSPTTLLPLLHNMQCCLRDHQALHHSQEIQENIHHFSREYEAFHERLQKLQQQLQLAQKSLDHLQLMNQKLSRRLHTICHIEENHA